MSNPIEKEFETKPVGHFEPHELAEESKVLTYEYQTNGHQNLREKYLHQKVLCNVYKNPSGQMVISGVIEGREGDFVKYDKIYRAWATKNIPNTQMKKSTEKTVA